MEKLDKLILEERKKDLMARREAMVKEIEALTIKYKLSMTAVLDYKEFGIVPIIAFIDDKNKEEEVKETKLEV